MTTFAQELTGRCVPAGGDRHDPDAHRMTRTVFVCETLRTSYDAGKGFGIDRAYGSSHAALFGAPDEHLEHIAHDVIRSVTKPPNSGGGAA